MIFVDVSGILVFTLAVKDSAAMWLSSEADNIVEPSDLRALAYSWELHKLQKVGRIMSSGEEWVAAADLSLWCLQTNPDRRPQSFKDVCEHLLFKPGGKLRYVRLSGDEYETWETALERRIIEVHREAQGAGRSGVSDRLKGIFAWGGVHINFTLKNSTVRLLHRAAYLGNLELTKYLLTEVHPQARVEVLNVKTAGGYTPLHWCAAACGGRNTDAKTHERYRTVAEFLLESGSDPTIVNSRGQTA
eukprot:COSAG06_NODE_14151_length_1184_cov_1.220276_2_plen_245_part_01